MNSKQSCIAGSVFRLFVCGLAIITWYMGFFEARSLNSLIARTSDGAMILWIMLACGITGALDVILNDYPTALGKPAFFESAVTHRHFGFTALAFCYVSLVFIAISKIESAGLAMWCLWNAIFIVVLSLVDAYQRYTDAEKQCLKAFN